MGLVSFGADQEGVGSGRKSGSERKLGEHFLVQDLFIDLFVQLFTFEFILIYHHIVFQEKIDLIISVVN